MDRNDQLIAKMDTLIKLHNGALNLTNRDMTLTTTFNSLLRFLLDNYPTRITPEEARELAPKVQSVLGHGFITPKASCFTKIDERLVAFVAVRYILHDTNLSLATQYFSPDWAEFVSDYMSVLMNIQEPVAPQTEL